MLSSIILKKLDEDATLKGIAFSKKKRGPAQPSPTAGNQTVISSKLENTKG
jgi:hypothetical protein